MPNFSGQSSVLPLCAKTPKKSHFSSNSFHPVNFNTTKMADSAPELKRDTTMKATAEEGAEFLKRQGGEDLVYKGESDKPKLAKDTTIQATVKEAEKILENENIDKDAKTRGDQERIDAAKAESEPPKVPRDNTMVATAAEGKEILGDEQVGETRAQTKVIKETAEVTAGGDAKEDETSLKRPSTTVEDEEVLKKQKTSNGDSETKEEAPAQEAS